MPNQMTTKHPEMTRKDPGESLDEQSHVDEAIVWLDRLQKTQGTDKTTGPPGTARVSAVRGI